MMKVVQTGVGHETWLNIKEVAYIVFRESKKQSDIYLRDGSNCLEVTEISGRDVLATFPRAEVTG